MTLKIDFHCHSTASDGALSPAELIKRAAGQNVNVISLTDHDTTAGLAEAEKEADAHDIHFIPGIELSTTWNNRCFHVVGLNIDPSYAPLQEGLNHLRRTRIERAKKISDKLSKKGITGAFEAVEKQAGAGMITRTHFAEFLVKQQHATSMQNAFDRFLSKGKPGYVSTRWTELDIAVDWIKGAGGIAVLAHPMRYKITASWMKRLLQAFKEYGGQGIEVIAGRNNPDEIRLAANYAMQFDLWGSVGSDFHNPENPWIELGRLSPLPEPVKPVWNLINFDPNLNNVKTGGNL